MRLVRLDPLTDAVGIHLLRLAVMWAVLEIAPLVAITGWYGGLAVSVVITLLAAAIMTRRGLWVSTGMVVPWRSGLALAALAPFVFEVVAWVVPEGVVDDEPGLALWLLTLLLVGLNEEMFSRGIVLTSLRRAYRPLPAVAITGALFGLQHLSALVLTSRGFGDVATERTSVRDVRLRPGGLPVQVRLALAARTPPRFGRLDDGPDGESSTCAKCPFRLQPSVSVRPILAAPACSSVAM